MKAFVRLDKFGNVVVGSLIYRDSKPTVGKWREIPQECCGTTTTIPPTTTTTSTTVAFTPNLILMSIGWNLVGVTDASSFVNALLARDMTVNSITGFSIIGSTLSAQIDVNINGTTLDLNNLLLSQIIDLTCFDSGVIVEIDLSNNNLDEIPPLTGVPSSAIVLGMANNVINTVTNLGFYSSLNYLDLSTNLLTELEPALNDCPTITTLIISNNDIASVHANFNMPNLANVDMSDNLMVAPNWDGLWGWISNSSVTFGNFISFGNPDTVSSSSLVTDEFFIRNWSYD